MKELTQREWARKGAIATNTKYPKEVRIEWSRKGGLKSAEKRKKKKIEAKLTP